MSKNNSVKLIIISVTALAVVFIMGLALSSTSKTKKEQTAATEATNSLVGKLLPDMQLTDKTGKVYSVADLKGKNAILFFSEGIMCYPACWDQIVAFGRDPRFNSQDTVALSIVIDSPQQWEQAKTKMPDLAKATILFDPNAKVSKQYGLLSAQSSMHAGSMPGHTYIIVDKKGVVREVFDDANMAVNNDKLFEMISKY